MLLFWFAICSNQKHNFFLWVRLHCKG